MDTLASCLQPPLGIDHLGGDRFGAEFSKTGEQLDDRVRARMLDESRSVLTAAWSGEPVHHHGEHYLVDGIRFLPRPVQEPGIPVWIAGFYGSSRPLARAARYSNCFPANAPGPDEYAEVVAQVQAVRGPAAGPYDFAVELSPDTDPTPYAEAGATWTMVNFDPEAMKLDDVRGVLRSGPRIP